MDSTICSDTPYSVKKDVLVHLKGYIGILCTGRNFGPSHRPKMAPTSTQTVRLTLVVIGAVCFVCATIGSVRPHLASPTQHTRHSRTLTEQEHEVGFTVESLVGAARIMLESTREEALRRNVSRELEVFRDAGPAPAARSSEVKHPSPSVLLERINGRFLKSTKPAEVRELEDLGVLVHQFDRWEDPKLPWSPCAHTSNTPLCQQRARWTAGKNTSTKTDQDKKTDRNKKTDLFEISLKTSLSISLTKILPTNGTLLDMVS